MTATSYDQLGRGYSHARRPDPRIAARVDAALGDARTVLNVGAGTGSYEPPDRDVTAVEPSTEMITQRPPGSAPVIQARAEDLPFEDRSFDATMAVLTVHHWTDLAADVRSGAWEKRHGHLREKPELDRDQRCLTKKTRSKPLSVRRSTCS